MQASWSNGLVRRWISCWPDIEAHRQLAWAEFGLAQRQLDDLGLDRLGDPVPDAVGPRAVIGERLDPPLR